MNIQFEKNGRKYRAESDQGIPIAIELDFNGEQPNHFGVETASSMPIEIGDFIGRTNAGGGCNVDVVTLIPHCNGTHTESVGHIVEPNVPVARLAQQSHFLAELITVEPSQNHDGDSYIPELAVDDRIITAKQIKAALKHLSSGMINALIVRTLPNDESKRSRVYGKDAVPGFFSSQAMELIVESKINHLLVDLPSVDRMHDDGKLSNHHFYWDVEQGKHALREQSMAAKTITEMIYVPSQCADGTYLLSLQIAPFLSDAAPSRPILYPCEVED